MHRSSLLFSLLLLWLLSLQQPAAHAYGTGPESEPAPNPAFSNSEQLPPPWDILSRARTLIEAGRPQESLPHLQQFIQLRPLEPEGYFWQGVALDNLQQPESALKCYSYGIAQVQKAGMDSAELHINAGNALLKLGRLPEATEQFKQAAQIDPCLPICHLNLARAFIAAGDSQNALKSLQACESLHFNAQQLAYYRAKALVLAGRHNEARAPILESLSRVQADQHASAKLQQEFAPILHGGDTTPR